MSLRDYLKPIGTLLAKDALADTDKIIVYPNDYPLAPVGTQVTTLAALETELTAEVAGDISELTTKVNAIHQDLHLYSTLIAKGTEISAVTKIILTVPASMAGYSITGLRLHTYAVVGATAVAGKVTVEGADATVSVGIATGEYSGSGGVPMTGYVGLAEDDEIRIVISAGSGGDGLDAIIDLSWFSPYTPTNPE
jgi:hypothetical protein